MFFLLPILLFTADFHSLANVSSPVNFDHRDSLNVRFVGRCDTPGYAWDVDVSGPYTHVACDTAGLLIYELLPTGVVYREKIVLGR